MNDMILKARFLNLAQYMPEIEEDSEELINLRRAGYLSKSVY